MKDFDFILAAMFEICEKRAIRKPTPSSPPESQWEPDADDYIRQSAMSETLTVMSPQVAAALLPRIEAAQDNARRIQEHLDVSLAREATAGELLEELLLIQWHAKFKAEWMAGKFTPHR